MQSANFVLKFKRTPNHRPTIIVSKAVAKRAVDRNRIRRITKEALRKIKNTDSRLVIIIKNNIADLKPQQVQKELETMLLSKH